MKQITVTVPATSANLGPGFDCLGLALTLHNEAIFTETADTQLTISIQGDCAGTIPTDSHNLIYQAADKTFAYLGKRPSGLHISQCNTIPVGSGLGSSSAAIITGILGANALVNGNLTRLEVLTLAIEMEGHADNVTPALYGGLTLTLNDGDQLHVEQITIPPLQVVIVLPDFAFPTSQARAALPPQIPRQDAIFNIGRMGLLIHALTTADHNKLRLAMQDRLHQPYRFALIPGSEAVIQAAYHEGATAVALSGAGPSLIAFAPHNHQAISQVMQHAFAQVGLKSRAWILQANPQGATVTQKQKNPV
jgi:homoserine kinase